MNNITMKMNADELILQALIMAHDGIGGNILAGDVFSQCLQNQFICIHFHGDIIHGCFSPFR